MSLRHQESQKPRERRTAEHTGASPVLIQRDVRRHKPGEGAGAGDRRDHTAISRRRRGRRVAVVYGLGAATVVGWASYLGMSLPDRNVARHWNVAWVGIDGLIIVALAFTAWRSGHSDRRVVLPATATATLLMVDAWIDVTTAARADLWQSILLAVALELPLAALSLLIAWRTLESLVHDESERRPIKG